MFDIYMVGTSGMQPLSSRKLASAMAKINGEITLIDAGEGTQVGIRESGWCIKSIGTILITHMHTDHILGLPGVLLAINNAGRTDNLTIVGPTGIMDFVEQFKCVLPNLSYSICYMELEDSVETFNIGYLEATAFTLSHTIKCYGYSLLFRRTGKFDIEKSNIIERRYWNELQRGNSIDTGDEILTSDMLIGEERRGVKFTYVTDTRPVDSIIKFAKDSDIFICEGMYVGTDPKDDENKIAKYHMTFSEAATLARNAKVKKLFLTHFSPSIPKPRKSLKEAKEVFPNTCVASDNMVITVEYTNDDNEHSITYKIQNAEDDLTQYDNDNKNHTNTYRPSINKNYNKKYNRNCNKNYNKNCKQNRD